MEALSVDTNPEEAQTTPINIAMPDPPATVDPIIASAKVNKAKLGIPSFTMPQEGMLQNVMEGREDQIRKQAAAMLDFQKSLNKQQIINDLASKQTRPFTPIEAKTISDFLDVKATDPNSVFEEYFAKHYMDNLQKAAKDNPDSFLNEAMQIMPEEFHKEVEKGVDLKAKKEYAQQLAEKVHAAAQDQSWLRTGANILKYILPFYNEANLRGLMGNYKNLLGENLNKTANDTYFLPFDKFKEKNSAIVDSLLSGKLGGNPYLAATYIEALTDQTQTGTIINNVFSAVDLSAIGAKPAQVLARLRLNNQIKTSIAQTLKAEDPATTMQKFALGRTFFPAQDSAFTPKSMAVEGYLSKIGKDIETTATSDKFVFPRRFTPEKAFEPQSMSVSSYLQDVGKRIETASAEAAGNVREAGVIEATRQMVSKMTPAGPVSSVGRSVEPVAAASTADAVKGLQSTFNESIQKFRADPRGYSQELVNRIAENTLTLRNNLAEAISNTLKVERIPAALAVEKNIRALEAKIRNDYPGINNAIQDVKFVRDPQTGVIMSHTYFGKTGTELFGKENTAKNWAIHASFKDKSVIEPNGAGFHVKVIAPVDETQPVIRNGLLALQGTKTPESWLNAWGGYLGGLRTPNETLAFQQTLNRAVAAYGPATLNKLAYETAKDIRALRSWKNLPGTAARQKWNEWKRVVDESKRTTQGKMLDSPGELSDLYQNTIHRIPDEQEVAAYFAYKNQQFIKNELEHLTERTNKLRLGAETHTIYVPDPSKQRINSIGTTSIKVDGTKLTILPNDGEHIFVIGDMLGKERSYKAQNLISKTWKNIQEELNTGGKWTLIKLTNPEERPFYHWGAGDNRPRYVLAKNVDSKPLEWNISPKSPIDYDYDHYVAQPIIRRDTVTGLNHYEGDRHVAAFNIRAMSQDVAAGLNTIRQYLKAEDITGANAFHARSKLPQEFSEIEGWFKSGVTTEGLPIPSRLSLEESIRSIPYNRVVRDLDKSLETKYGRSLSDETKENLKRLNTDPDHLFTYENKGTRSNPDYTISPVKFVDPITSMNRSLSRVIQEHYLNDYKLFSVEHWIEEARPWLTVSDNDLRAAPTYFFHNAEQFFKQETPVQLKNNLLTSQLQIKQFLGIQDKTDTYLHAAAQKLADSIYSKSGENSFLLSKVALLPTLRDPITFVRGAVFDMKLGLFALPQLWVQLQTFTNIMGIAGFSHAAPGARATLLHQWSRFSHNPDILDHLDKLASTWNIPGTKFFKPGEWKEAHALLNRTGFEHVAGEYALRDNPFGHELVGSAPASFLSFGRVAFTEGERATRIGAWYTAYREYREANPTGAVSNSDLRTILNRADLLTMNMSRASVSTLNKGLFSIPTQFLTYSLRTAELFLGKRLTPVERWRLFGTNAAMYGLPAAFGLSGIPFGEMFRKNAIEDGYVVGDNYINSLVTEGGLSTLLAHLASGSSTPKSKDYYNVAERYGNIQGVQVLSDTFRSDKTFWDIVGGAPYSALSNAIGSMDGFTNTILSAIRDDNKAYKMTVEDFIKPFLEISAVNNAWKLGLALNTAKWMSKKEAYVTDVTAGNAIFMFLSGLSPQEQSDMFNKNMIRDNEKKIQTEALSRFTTKYQQYLVALEDNPEQARDYLKNAFAILRIASYPEERIPAAVAIATQGYESLVNRTNRDFTMKDVPESRKKPALEAFDKILKQRNEP